MRGVVCAGLLLLGTLVIASGAPAPPARLSDTGLFADAGSSTIDPRHRSFSPQYPLWSDGMIKQRWVSLPEGATIDATDEHAWQFPVGTRFWKEFRLGDRRVETRFLWRATASRWVAATYVWNAEGTDAELAPEGGVPRFIEVAPGRRHSIPSRSDCAACHGPAERSRVLGFNALQLSPDRDPGALHGEPLAPGMVTLATLEAQQRISPRRPERLTDPPRVRTSNPATRAMLGYLAANCGVCHDGSGEIAGFGVSLAYRDIVADGDAVVARLREHPTTWQIPGLPEGQSVLLRPGHSAESAMFVRMRSRSPSTQMAPLGSVVRDQEAVDAMAQWIDVTLAARR